MTVPMLMVLKDASQKKNRIGDIYLTYYKGKRQKELKTVISFQDNVVKKRNRKKTGINSKINTFTMFEHSVLVNVVWTLTRRCSCNWTVDDMNTCQWVIMHFLVLKFMKETGCFQCRAIRWSILWLTEILKWRPSLRSKTLLLKVQKFSRWIVLDTCPWMCVDTFTEREFL